MRLKKKLTLVKIIRLFIFIAILGYLLIIGMKLTASVFLTTVTNSSKYELTEPISVMIVGTDYGANRDALADGLHSDSVVVATFNPKNNRGHIEANMVSIPRDTIVKLDQTCGAQDETTYSKLADVSSYSYQKDENLDTAIGCTQKAVEDLLNIKINYYISTGFDGLINIIDAIGGIDIDVPYDFCSFKEDGTGYVAGDPTNCNENSYHFTKGKMHMNGSEALSYARQRYDSSDYDRNIRQQQVIITIVKKIMIKPEAYVDNFIKVFLKDFTTNLNYNLLMKFINYGTNTTNYVLKNISNDTPLIFDIKKSAYENDTSSTATGETGTTSSIKSNDELNNVEYNLISDYYDSDKILDFESDTMIERHYFNKNVLNAPTAEENIMTENQDKQNTNQIIVEFSSYSLKSEDANLSSGYYSYANYQTLYYASNLLRTGMGEEVAEPTFDYAAAGITSEATGTDSLTNGEIPVETPNDIYSSLY